MKQLIVLGASGHGKVVADIARKNGYNDIKFLDDNVALKECGGYPVVGKIDEYEKFDCDIFVAIGNPTIRENLQEQIREEQLPVLIHPSASVAENVKIGKGTVVVAGAVINSEAQIGKGCIINTCSSVDHDCKVADYVHISVGSHIAGTVNIGTRTWIGAGAIVINNINICNDCMVGAGAVVVKDIQERGTYLGIPARRTK